MNKRLIALFLCLVMMLSVFLAGCAESTEEDAKEELEEAKVASNMTLTMWIVSESPVSDSIRNDVTRAIARKKKAEKRDRFEEVAKGAYGYGDRINPDRARAPAVAGCEDAVLGLMLLFPEHRKAAKSEAMALTEEDFFTSFSKRVAAFLLEPYNEMTVDSAEMYERFSP